MVDNEAADRSGPLRSIRVVEFAGIGPVPHAAMVLSDLGADVVRVQRPGQLEATSTADALLRGRRFVEVDLKLASERDRILSLLAEADVLLEGFRPGVMERLGLGPDDLARVNERLIYGRITGWGQEGPRARTAGHDLNYLSLTGMLHAIGRSDEKPVPPLNLLGDFGGGSMFLVAGVLAALVERSISGKGDVIDAAICDGVSILGQMIWAFRGTGRWQDRRGSNRLDGGAPFYGVYETSDAKWMAVAAIEPKFYAELLRGLALDPGVLPEQNDVARWGELAQVLTNEFRTKTRDQWTAIFEGTDACVSPILDFVEAADDAHLRARGSLVEIDGVTQAQAAPRFLRSATRTPEARAPSASDPESIWRR